MRKQEEYSGYVTEINTASVTVSNEMSPLGKNNGLCVDVLYSLIDNYRKLGDVFILNLEVEASNR